MKVEYSYYKDNPCMVVKGTDFMRALKDKEEYDLLGIAVEGFCSRIESAVHFNNEVNKAIKYWLGKNGIVTGTDMNCDSDRNGQIKLYRN